MFRSRLVVMLASHCMVRSFHGCGMHIWHQTITENHIVIDLAVLKVKKNNHEIIGHVLSVSRSLVSLAAYCCLEDSQG